MVMVTEEGGGRRFGEILTQMESLSLSALSLESLHLSLSNASL